MYQGKHQDQNKRVRRKHNQKANVLLTSLVLLLTLLVGGTVAFMIAGGTPVENKFTPSEVTCEVTEDSFDGTKKTNVKIQNTGDTTAYIRAAIVVTWKDAANGNVYGGKPAAGTDYTISLNTTDWFYNETDGFYYYTKPVDAEDSTTALINSCTPVDDNTPKGYGLNVEILGSAIQSVPTSVVKDNWGVTVTDDGTLSK